MAKFVRALMLVLSCLSATIVAEAKPRPPTLPDRTRAPPARPTPEPAIDSGATQNDKAEDVPLPEPRPSRPTDAPAGRGAVGVSDNGEKKTQIESVGRHNARNFTPRIDPTHLRAEEACQQRLKQLGVKFEPQAPLSDPQGCSLPVPLSVSALGDGISLEPAGVMNCAMTETAARFAQTVVAPAAKSVYDAELKAIANASAYVCRPRNGTTKLSEHAFGNALDMARFVLADGTAVDVAATSEPKASMFLDRVRKAACGPFKTVLGPGSDADHATHFHIDLAPRRNGATFCQ